MFPLGMADNAAQLFEHLGNGRTALCALWLNTVSPLNAKELGLDPASR
jgi:hypothetical protein